MSALRPPRGRGARGSGRRVRGRAWRRPRDSPRDGRAGCASRAPRPARRRRRRARRICGGLPSGVKRSGSGSSWRQSSPACCRRRAGAGRSRCRAPPGSPRACRARRRRSAASRGRCRRAAGRHEGAEIGAQLAHLQAGDEAGEIEGMRADVADAAAGARRCAGSVRQAACFWPVCSSGFGQPVLRIFDLDDADAGRAARPATISRACRTIG